MFHIYLIKFKRNKQLAMSLQTMQRSFYDFATVIIKHWTINNILISILKLLALFCSHGSTLSSWQNLTSYGVAKHETFISVKKTNYNNNAYFFMKTRLQITTVKQRIDWPFLNQMRVTVSYVKYKTLMNVYNKMEPAKTSSKSLEKLQYLFNLA